MEVRDPIHGSIAIAHYEEDILEHAFFRRLRNIKQLGFSEYVFPGATHSRFLHSIGVMDVVTKVFDKLFKDEPKSAELNKLRQTVRLACLLHDIGHAPLSHTTEFVMPMVDDLKLPPFFAGKGNRQASHEDYTIKSIIDSSFTASFYNVSRECGVECNQVAELIIGNTQSKEYFTYKGINYFPLLHQLVSSEMDCDRMDYLLRDSYFCGVSYGKFDLDWIIDNLKITVINNEAMLGISERALATFDDFLLSRFHMFLMVYFHYKAVCLEKLLQRYFESAPHEYKIPANIEAYLEHDDHFLMKVLRSSQNQWAKRIVANDIPLKIFETFGQSQTENLAMLEGYLSNQNIDFIKCSSQGRLSKYYSVDGNHTKYPIKVVRESSIALGQIKVQNITEATDLFEKFSKSHSVDRIHCDYYLLSDTQKREIQKIITT